MRVLTFKELRDSLSVLAVVTAVTLACGGSADAASPAANSEDAVAYQINVAHSGSIDFTAGFAPPLEQLWTENLGGIVSYPLIAHDMVFVTVADTGSYGSELYALDLATGAVNWQKLIGGESYWSSIAYDRGHVFVIDSSGVVQSFQASDGTDIWNVQLPVNTYEYYGSTPIVKSGLVFVGGWSAQPYQPELFALDERSGDNAWSQTLEYNGGNTTGVSPPVAAAGGVFVSQSCETFGFEQSNGTPLWNAQSGCSGYMTTPVYFEKELFVRTGDDIFDIKDGNLKGSFSADPAPAFYQKSYGLAINSGNLYDFNIKSGNVAWTFSNGNLTAAPIVVNGQPIVGDSDGNLYLLDGATGAELWSTNVGAPILAPAYDGYGGGDPVTGIAAGENILVVPAADQISAFAPQSAPRIWRKN